VAHLHIFKMIVMLLLVLVLVLVPLAAQEIPVIEDVIVTEIARETGIETEKENEEAQHTTSVDEVQVPSPLVIAAAIDDTSKISLFVSKMFGLG